MNTQRQRRKSALWAIAMVGVWGAIGAACSDGDLSLGGSGSGSSKRASGGPDNFSGAPDQSNGALADPVAPSPAPNDPKSLKKPTGNTNVNLGGSQDFGFFRNKLANRQVPQLVDFDAAGFFAEHHTPLPQPVCGKRICLHAMIGVMGNLTTGNNCTMLQIGLNSPVVADPMARPPLTLAVTVDVSGSMAAGNKIGFVRDGLGKLIDGLRDTDRLALLTYSNAVQVVFPMQEIGLNRAALRATVQGLNAEGGTNIFDGLKAAYEQVRMHYDSGRQNRVIMLSDGRATVGITDDATITQMSRTFNSDGIGVTTIGLGNDFNAEMMRGLAQQADGNFYFVENSGAVAEVFTEELSYFTVPVALDLKVDVVVGPYYTLGRAFGSPFWQGNPNGGSLAVPSVFLAHRQSHADQTPSGGRRGGGSALLLEMMPRTLRDDGTGTTSADIALLRVSFREPGSNATITDEIVVQYPEAPWITRETGLFAGPDIAIVQKSFVMLNMYAGIENACRTFHENRASAGEHIGLLRRLIAAVRDYNEEIQDKDIEADTAMVQDLINVMLANGVVDPQRVIIPANPWPAD